MAEHIKNTRAQENKIVNTPGIKIFQQHERVYKYGRQHDKTSHYMFSVLVQANTQTAHQKVQWNEDLQKSDQ